MGPEADLGTGSDGPRIDLVHSYFLSILKTCSFNESHYLGPNTLGLIGGWMADEIFCGFLMRMDDNWTWSWVADEFGKFTLRAFFKTI